MTVRTGLLLNPQSCICWLAKVGSVASSHAIPLSGGPNRGAPFFKRGGPALEGRPPKQRFCLVDLYPASLGEAGALRARRWHRRLSPREAAGNTTTKIFVEPDQTLEGSNDEVGAPLLVRLRPFFGPGAGRKWYLFSGHVQGVARTDAAMNACASSCSGDERLDVEWDGAAVAAAGTSVEYDELRRLVIPLKETSPTSQFLLDLEVASEE